MITYNELISALPLIKDDEVLFNYLTSYEVCLFICKNFNKLYSNEKFSFSFNNERYYKKLILYFDNFYFKIFIIKNIKDENLKCELILSLDNNTSDKDYNIYNEIKNFKNDENILKIIKNLHDFDIISSCYLLIKNEKILKKNLGKLNKYDLLKYVLTLPDDEKTKYLNLDLDNIAIISSMKKGMVLSFNDELSFKDRKKLTYSVKDYQIKYELFKLNKDLFSIEETNNLLCEIYSFLKDKTILNYFKGDEFKRVIYSNEDIVSSENVYPIKLSNIYTFGLEFECTYKYSAAFIKLNNILNDFIVKEKTSISNGFKVSSPVLKYDKESLGKIKYICNLLSLINAKVNNSCAGHIHIGYSCFKTKEELQRLFELYTNNQNIFYLLSNRKGTLLRKNASFYSMPLNDILISNIKSGYFDNAKDLKSFTNLLFLLQDYSRYYEINLSNLYKTIEFRVPNGEINYDEILLNIILYLKLIDICLTINNKDLYDYLTRIDVCEDTKKDLLLNLICDNDTNLSGKFNERYIENYYLARKNDMIIKPRERVKFK